MTATTDFETVDFFRARPIYQNPYPYYEWLRDHGPVWREPKYGIVMVTGYDEAVSVYHDAKTFSNCNTIAGPFTKWPVPLEGDDISDVIEEHRDTLPFSDQLPSFDPPHHTEQRGLLMRLITPKRLKENEEFMWRLADQQIDEFLANGRCEFVHEYANPFTLMVVADLLGVPDEDRPQFREELQGEHRPVDARPKGAMVAHKPLEFLYERFTKYIENRRQEPRQDVMTELALATFSDGSLPPVDDVMRIASNLFAAGQETTARMMSTCLRFIGEDPELQQRLRDDRELIPRFIEECVRLESPLQGQFRLSRVPTKVGELEIPAGTSVFLMPGAANRDPREFPNPTALDFDRANGRQHLGFGFGIHLCAGAPLARAEGVVTLNRLLDRMADIRIDEAEHGPPDARRYEYTPVYLMRGLEWLYLDFSPIDN